MGLVVSFLKAPLLGWRRGGDDIGHGSRLRLRIAGEPEADGAGLGIVGIGFEDFEVMLARFGRVMQLLGVEIAKRKVGTAVVRIFFEELFKFADGAGEVVVLFEQQSQVVASVE